MLVTLRYKSGHVEQVRDVDMLHDGRMGLTILHRSGAAHLRRRDVALIEITMSPKANKSAELVEELPYLQPPLIRGIRGGKDHD